LCAVTAVVLSNGEVFDISGCYSNNAVIVIVCRFVLFHDLQVVFFHSIYYVDLGVMMMTIADSGRVYPFK